MGNCKEAVFFRHIREVVHMNAQGSNSMYKNCTNSSQTGSQYEVLTLAKGLLVIDYCQDKKL